MEVVVDDEQLSIAIGKRGQNVRLAAKLTGWNIDVRSEAEKRRDTEAAMGQALSEAPAETIAPKSMILEELGEVEGLTEAIVENLAAAGHLDIKSLYTMTAEQLLTIEGMDQDLAFRLIDAVHARFGE